MWGVVGVLGCVVWRLVGCRICVEVCVSVYGWRWLVDGWWYVEMEVWGVVGVFGVWRYVNRERGMWRSA